MCRHRALLGGGDVGAPLFCSPSRAGADLPFPWVHVESPHQCPSSPSSSFPGDSGSRIPRPLTGSSSQKIPPVFFPVCDWNSGGDSHGPGPDLGTPSALLTLSWDFWGLVCNMVCIWVSSYSIAQHSQLAVRFASLACTNARSPKVWTYDSNRNGHS